MVMLGDNLPGLPGLLAGVYVPLDTFEELLDKLPTAPFLMLLLIILNLLSVRVLSLKYAFMLRFDLLIVYCFNSCQNRFYLSQISDQLGLSD